LTRREEDVVRLVADGLKNREIAQRLKVKEHSVRNYIYRIFEKLGVSSRVELILYVCSRRNGAP
jgi:DNA-binding NarL/FixJ family response regulator